MHWIADHAAEIGLQFVRQFNMLDLPFDVPETPGTGIQLINPNAGGAVILAMYTELYDEDNGGQVCSLDVYCV